MNLEHSDAKNIANKSQQKIENLSIIGLGMISGSMLLDMLHITSNNLSNKKSNNTFAANSIIHLKTITILGKSLANLEYAENKLMKLLQELNLNIDIKIFSTLNQPKKQLLARLATADLVILAAPIQITKEYLLHLSKYLRPDSLVTDVSSAKHRLIKTYQKLKNKNPNIYTFIAGHPISGKEKSGFSYAEKGLFKSKTTLLCNSLEHITEESSNQEKNKKANQEAGHLKMVIQLWTELNSKIEFVDPKTHDYILGVTSHLPHLLSFALVDMLGKQHDTYIHDITKVFNFNAGGFKDFTRIASSNPKMWRDIFSSNKEFLLYWTSKYIKELEEFTALIKNDDFDKLEQMLYKANQIRNKITSKK